MENQKEIWKTIDGFNNYKISNIGRIKSIERYKNNNGGLVYVPEKILILNPSTKGYNFVRITENKINKTLYSHRLVALYFIDNPLNKPQVNHINGIKTDNRADNLEWCTNRENTTHHKEFFKNGKTSKYVGVHFAKQSNKFCSQIRIENKTRSLGYFKSELDAKKAYDLALENYNRYNIVP